MEFLQNRRSSENQKPPENLRKLKTPRKLPRKWTFLSLAFYNAPSLHTVKRKHRAPPKKITENPPKCTSKHFARIHLRTLRNPFLETCNPIHGEPMTMVALQLWALASMHRASLSATALPPTNLRGHLYPSCLSSSCIPCSSLLKVPCQTRQAITLSFVDGAGTTRIPIK